MEKCVSQLPLAAGTRGMRPVCFLRRLSADPRNHISCSKVNFYKYGRLGGMDRITGPLPPLVKVLPSP